MVLLWWFSDESLLHLQHQHTIEWWHQAQHLPFLLPPLHLGLCPTPACTGCSGNTDAGLVMSTTWTTVTSPKIPLYSHLALCKNSKLHIAIVPAHMPALKTIFCQLFKVNEDISPMFPSKASWQWKLVSLPFFLHIIRSSSSHKRDNIRTVIWWLLWPHHYRQNTSC